MGVMPTVVKKARARRERASGPFACLPARALQAHCADVLSAFRNSIEEAAHVCALFPQRPALLGATQYRR